MTCAPALSATATKISRPAVPPYATPRQMFLSAGVRTVQLMPSGLLATVPAPVATNWPAAGPHTTALHEPSEPARGVHTPFVVGGCSGARDVLKPAGIFWQQYPPVHHSQLQSTSFTEFSCPGAANSAQYSAPQALGSFLPHILLACARYQSVDASAFSQAHFPPRISLCPWCERVRSLSPIQ